MFNSIKESLYDKLQQDISKEKHELLKQEWRKAELERKCRELGLDPNGNNSKNDGQN